MKTPYERWREHYDELALFCEESDIDPEEVEKCPRCGLRQELPICCPRCGWCEYGVEGGCPECTFREEEMADGTQAVSLRRPR